MKKEILLNDYIYSLYLSFKKGNFVITYKGNKLKDIYKIDIKNLKILDNFSLYEIKKRLLFFAFKHSYTLMDLKNYLERNFYLYEKEYNNFNFLWEEDKKNFKLNKELANDYKKVFKLYQKGEIPLYDFVIYTYINFNKIENKEILLTRSQYYIAKKVFIYSSFLIFLKEN